MSNQCRICFEDIEKSNNNSNKLITPCLCNGSCKINSHKWELISEINRYSIYL